MHMSDIGISVLGLLLVATAACDRPATTEPDPKGQSAAGEWASNSRHGVPLRARLEGIGAVPDDPNRCAPLITAGNRTEGNMTHLGHVIGEHSQCIDPTGQLQDPLAYTDGRVTFTAANGDQLFATFAGTLIPTDMAGLFAADNPFVIVGGTGRFEGASGGGRATGSLDLRVPETPIVLNLEGELIIP